MGILEKFENVKIENDNRLSKEDMEAIDKFDKNFKELKEMYSKHVKFLNENQFKKPCFNDSYFKMTKNNFLANLHNLYISEANHYVWSIVRYFNDKYGTTIAYAKILKDEGNYKTSDYDLDNNRNLDTLKWYQGLTKDVVLDELFDLLGGFNFEDKALKEVIDFMKKETKPYYRDSEKKVKIIKNKIQLINFASVYAWSNWGDAKLQNSDNFVWLNKALTSFETGQVAEDDTIKAMIHQQSNCWYNGKLVLEFSKVAYLKIYKNGKTEIGFTSNQYALDFANTYLWKEN